MIATLILYVLPEYLRFLRDFRMLLYAIVLIVMMLLNNNAKFKLLVATVSGKVKSLFVKPSKKAKITEGGQH